MAGDWLKVETATPDKPEVYAIASVLNIDSDAVFGKLFRVWAWFDQHTESGNAPIVTKMLLDRIASVSGFADAMVAAGWLLEQNGQLQLPNFDRHNGKTAKTRALTAKRVAEHKKKMGNGASVTPALPREEKRRVKEPPLPPRGFDEFWSAYPKKRNKGQAEKAWSKLKPDEQLHDRIMRAVERSKTSAEWTKNNGQFIPYPATWLNAKGWEDEMDEEESSYAAGAI